MSATKIEIPGLGSVVVDAKPDTPERPGTVGPWRGFLTWACHARIAPADPQDIVENIRAILCPEYLDGEDMSDRTTAMEGSLHLIDALLSVVEVARLQNRIRQARGSEDMFGSADLDELAALARRLARTSGHLWHEIERLENEQDALWSVAVDAPAEAAE